jgi:hypothetical protein
MKTKIILYLFAIVGLAFFATGCCTSQLLNTSRQKPVDYFRPTAVYQTTNRDSFALEGFRANGYVAAEMREPPHKFVILSQECLKSAHFETNENLSLEEIYKLPSSQTHQLKIINKLPANYVKINELPYSTWQIELNEQPPQKAVLVFIPFTVAIDVATAPIQIPFYLFIGLMMSGGHT